MAKKKDKACGIGKLYVVNDGWTWPIPIGRVDQPDTAAAWVWGDRKFAKRLVKVWNRSLKSLLVLFVSFCSILASAQLAPANPPASVTLAWDASPSPVTGYNLYYGVGPRAYTNMVGTAATTISVTNLVRGATYYFAVTAYNVAGLESDFSNEISYTVPAPPLPPQNLHLTNALLKVLLERAPSPAGPWEPAATLGTVTSGQGFFRSVVNIQPAETSAKARPVQKSRILRSPKNK